MIFCQPWGDKSLKPIDLVENHLPESYDVMLSLDTESPSDYPSVENKEGCEVKVIYPSVQWLKIFALLS